MPDFYYLQSYFPLSLGGHKLGLFQVMLNALRGTPESFNEWVESVVWDEAEQNWSQTIVPPSWNLSMRKHDVEIRPHFMNWDTKDMPALSGPWVKISLLFKGEDIQSDSLSGFNIELLPLLEKIAVTMFKVLRPNELFFTKGTSEGEPWKALIGPDKGNLWGFELAVIGENSELHQFTIPNDYELRKIADKLWVIRNKWVSFDMKKGANLRS
jgi:hypothetical protein